MSTSEGRAPGETVGDGYLSVHIIETLPGIHEYTQEEMENLANLTEPLGDRRRPKSSCHGRRTSNGPL